MKAKLIKDGVVVDTMQVEEKISCIRVPFVPGGLKARWFAPDEPLPLEYGPDGHVRLKRPELGALDFTFSHERDGVLYYTCETKRNDNS